MGTWIDTQTDLVERFSVWTFASADENHDIVAKGKLAQLRLTVGYLTAYGIIDLKRDLFVNVLFAAFLLNGCTDTLQSFNGHGGLRK